MTVYATYIGAPNATLPLTYLPSPTSVLGEAGTVDDGTYTISNIPFPVSVYNVSTTNLTISPNGVSPPTP